VKASAPTELGYAAVAAEGVGMWTAAQFGVPSHPSPAVNMSTRLDLETQLLHMDEVVRKSFVAEGF
jgi:hypothetical protein